MASWYKKVSGKTKSHKYTHLSLVLHRFTAKYLDYLSKPTDMLCLKAVGAKDINPHLGAT